MNIIVAIIAGMLQGILEWIPISSQGILTLFLSMSGYDFSEAVGISIFLHIGTVFAVISYFKEDIKGLIKPKTVKDLNLLYFILSSSFISLLIGGPIYLFFKSSFSNFSTISVFIGLMLIITGLLQQIRKKFSLRKMDSNVTTNDGLFSGALQGFSIIPGISRSGITVFALLARGFNPDYALKLSFLMGIPIILLASIYEAVSEGFAFQLSYIAAAATAFFVGRLAIGFFLKFVKKVDFSIFCIFLGFLSIISAMF